MQKQTDRRPGKEVKIVCHNENEKQQQQQKTWQRGRGSLQQ